MSRDELVSALRELSERRRHVVPPHEDDQLRHDLHVHQIELEMQNRELREAHGELESSRSRYADLYDFAPIAYCTLSADGVVEELNLTASALFGVERSLAQGRPLASLVKLHEPNALRKHLATCAATRQSVVSELSMEVRGRSMNAEVVSVPVLSIGADSRTYRTAITDITRLKLAEASERRLRERLEALDDAQVELSTHLASADGSVVDTVVELITRRARALTKADIASLKLAHGDPHAELFGERPSWIDGLNSTPPTHEIRVELSYGGSVLGSLRVLRAGLEDPFSAYDRETLALFAARVAPGLRIATLSAVEAGERQRLALLEVAGRHLTPLTGQAEARLAVAAILDEMTGGFVDTALLCLREEERLELAHTAARDAALAGDLQQRLRELPGLPHLLDWLHSLDGGGPQRFDLHAREPVGVAAPIIQLATLLSASSLLVIPLRARDHTLGALCLARASGHPPFTHAEQSWVQEISVRCGLALDGVQLFEELRSALDWRETLLASISHDLRGPLSAITLTAGALLPDERVTDRRRSGRQVDLIRRSAEHMSHMINDLLLESMLVSGTFQLELRKTAVAALLAEACQMSEAMAQAGGVRLVLDADAGAGLLEADGERVLRVLSNLIGNALKFSPPGASVRVHARGQGEQVLFAVSDAGPGIAPEQQRLVFKRYWRGQKGRGARGLGLGLYIAKTIVEAHGGELWLDSKLGAGATFMFTLPRRALRAGAPREPQR